eukprot:12402327-Karenia_brevis.AAC.1
MLWAIKRLCRSGKNFPETSGSRFVARWLPSEKNPADRPSRDFRNTPGGDGCSHSKSCAEEEAGIRDCSVNSAAGSRGVKGIIGGQSNIKQCGLSGDGFKSAPCKVRHKLPALGSSGGVTDTSREGGAGRCSAHSVPGGASGVSGLGDGGEDVARADTRGGVAA